MHATPIYEMLFVLKSQTNCGWFSDKRAIKVTNLLVTGRGKDQS